MYILEPGFVVVVNLYLYLCSDLGGSGGAIVADCFDLKVMATSILCRLGNELEHACQFVVLCQLYLSLQFKKRKKKKRKKKREKCLNSSREVIGYLHANINHYKLPIRN